MIELLEKRLKSAKLTNVTTDSRRDRRPEAAAGVDRSRA